MKIFFLSLVQSLALMVLPAVEGIAAPNAAHGASPAQTGRPAPAFDLPLINGDGYVNSRDLFASEEYTFLIFWDSGCPHCVESLLECEEFHQEHIGGDIAVIGIHADEGDIFDVHQLIEASGITFPQLWDLGGEAGQSYAIAFAEFTLFLVDRRGNIVARQFDPHGDIKITLNNMLSVELGGVPEKDEREMDSAGAGEPPPVESTAGFVYRGYQRARFLSIDTRGRGAAGPYGEEVQPGNNLLLRFELEMSRRITRHLRAGGLLRISNEDSKILELGPKYFGSKWGSAFAEISTGRFLLRFGYFEMSMTPLTMMRWDWDDNPRIGGNAGCGCGAAAGVLLVESLEELDPELTFEGGVFLYRRPSLETRVFYAIPRRARETSRLAVRYADAEPARYSLEIYGAETRWQKYDSRTESYWRAGIHFIGSWENERSVDFEGLDYAAADPWYTSTLVSAGWEVPVIRSLYLEGEWIVWNEAQGHGHIIIENNDFYTTTITTKGGGGIAGIVFNKPPIWNIRCDYIRLNSEFYSSFAALSYEPNREGIRFSAQVPLFRDVVAATFFYKKLREIEVLDPETEKEKDSFLGASLDIELPNGFGGTLGWLDNGTWRGGENAWLDDVRKVLVLGAQYRFDKSSSIQLQYQRITGSIKHENIDDNSLTNLFSVYIETHI